MTKKLSILFMMLLLVGMTANSSLVWADHNERSTKEKALIIGGSTAAGAVIGAVTGGKKGSLVGAIIGGAGSAIYEGATKNNGHRVERTGKEKTVLIGSSAGAGAAAGAIAGGTKGALIGAAIGAGAGYLLHRQTENKDRR
jgi:Glycine zipper